MKQMNWDVGRLCAERCTRGRTAWTGLPREVTN